MDKTIWSIRIYTRAGNQIDLDVEDFTLIPNQKWEAKWYENTRIMHLDPADIEAVVQLGFRTERNSV